MRIAVMAGDGIGPEVMRPALEMLPEDFEVVQVEVGAERWMRSGETLTDEDLAVVRDCDAVLFGAVGDPRVPDGILERGIILRLRKDLDLYVNLRPFPELDLVIVRENTEGLYVGAGGRAGGTAVETSINTSAAVDRCMRYAFGLAEQRNGAVTLVHKTNVLSFAGALWKEVTDAVHLDYPGVEVRYEHVDAAAYHLVQDATRFDVIVTDNLFGDVLSDIAAALAGGLGRAASANLHPDASTRPSRCIGLFEPVHGSAPDIAGQQVADTTAARRAAQMMLGALGVSTAKEKTA